MPEPAKPIRRSAADPQTAPARTRSPVQPAADPWIGIEAAAGYLAIPVRTLYRLAQRGEVPAAKVGRTWRFRRSLLDAHLGAIAPDSAAADASGRATVDVAGGGRAARSRPRTKATPSRRRSTGDGAGAAEPATSDPVHFLAALGDLAVGLSGRRDAMSIAAHCAAGLQTIFGVDLAGLIRLEGDELVTLPTGPTGMGVEVPPFRIPLALAPTLIPAVEAGQPVVIDDLLADPEAPATDMIRTLGLRSCVLVPVRESGSLWGMLGVATRKPRRFSDVEIERLGAVAGQVGLALTNARLLSEARRWSDHLEGIETLGRALARSHAASEVGEAVAREIDAVTEWDGIRFYVLQPDDVTLEAVTLRARVPYYADETAELTRLVMGEGLGGHIAVSGTAEIIPNVSIDPRMQDIPGTADQDESMVVVPLAVDDQTLGVLEVSRLGLDMFEPSDLRLLQIIGAQAAVALSNAKRSEELERQSRTDVLTGLPNRALFIERVEQALARRARLHNRIAVLFLDLDGFKVVNDSLGHAVGDQLLRAVGERLRRTIRASDMVARLGGDEFGVLIEDVRDAIEPVRAAERIGEALRAPMRLESRLVSIRASVGVVVDSGEAAGADELLRDADVAMYQAKAQGRAGYAVFEPAMHTAQVRRLELEGELRVAIERGEFALRYQPIVDLGTGQLAALEALLRWHHPVRGVISPLDFISLAEETGQIVPIGAWVLREACRQLARWRLDGVVSDEVRISINLSTRQLLDDRFLAEVETALAESNLAAERLVLEVTESVMLGEDSMAAAVLGVLRRQGVHVALDDFGTGYSSLGYLRALPADGIKIDRSFIDGLGSEREKALIVEAAIAFAHALELTVTAEGIETDLQMSQLRAMGCDLGQGFRLSPPLPGADLEALLRSGALLAGPGSGSEATSAA
jgi:diguanylate cyclase (GGDEF)-like protein/excisionase family DNA binding protein